jgi:hypothetical protein
MWSNGYLYLVPFAGFIRKLTLNKEAGILRCASFLFVELTALLYGIVY